MTEKIVYKTPSLRYRVEYLDDDTWYKEWRTNDLARAKMRADECADIYGFETRVVETKPSVFAKIIRADERRRIFGVTMINEGEN